MLGHYGGKPACLDRDGLDLAYFRKYLPMSAHAEQRTGGRIAAGNVKLRSAVNVGEGVRKNLDPGIATGLFFQCLEQLGQRFKQVDLLQLGKEPKQQFSFLKPVSADDVKDPHFFGDWSVFQFPQQIVLAANAAAWTPER
jgi:hypothetical protein